MQNKKKPSRGVGRGVGIFSGTTQFTFDFLFNKNKLLFTVSQSLLFVLLLPFFFFLHHSILLMGILTLQGILIKYGTSTVPNPIHSLST